jgi:hypothetical protein
LCAAGVLSYFANANCKDCTMLTVYNAQGANRVYPVADLTALPDDVLAGEPASLQTGIPLLACLLSSLLPLLGLPAAATLGLSHHQCVSASASCVPANFCRP